MRSFSKPILSSKDLALQVLHLDFLSFLLPFSFGFSFSFFLCFCVALFFWGFWGLVLLFEVFLR